MRDATGKTRHCRILCAASSGQRATSSMRVELYSTTSAQHGTDATQDATYDQCRSMHRTRTEPTTAAGNAMYEMRRTKSGRSRTSGHAAPAVVESDGVLDSDCRRVPSQSSRATRKTGHSGTAADPAKSDVPSGMHGESETSGSRRSEGARIGSPQSARTACQRSSQPSH
jgi:hypothetical protein